MTMTYAIAWLVDGYRIFCSPFCYVCVVMWITWKNGRATRWKTFYTD